MMSNETLITELLIMSTSQSMISLDGKSVVKSLKFATVLVLFDKNQVRKEIISKSMILRRRVDSLICMEISLNSPSPIPLSIPDESSHC